MESNKLQDWLQILGLFGVMSSLVFVGLQMKQSHEIARADAYDNRVSASVGFNAAVMGSPETMSAIAKLYEDKASTLTPVELVAAERYFGTSFSLYEGNHQQFLNGFMPEEHWQRNLQELECSLTVPLARAVAVDWSYRASFQAVLDEITATLPPDVENCYAAEWALPLY